MNFGSKTLGSCNPLQGNVCRPLFDIDQTVQTVKFGINDRFGAGAVVARY